MAVLIPKNGSPLRPSSIEDILEAMTPTPSQILGEPPLAALPPRPFRPPRISYEAALAITRDFVDPITLLGEPPLPKHLPPKKPRKRARVQSDEELPDTPPKKRKKGANIPSITITVPKKGEAGVSLSVGEKLNTDPVKQGKSLKLTVRLPRKTPTAVAPVSPTRKEEEAAVYTNLESATKPSAKEGSKQSRRRKEKSRLRPSPTPPSEGMAVQTALRSSPAPESDSQHGRKRKDRPALRSSPAPPADTNDARKVMLKSRSSPAVVCDRKGDRKDAERPMFRSSAVPLSEPKDSRKSSDKPKLKSSGAEYSDSRGGDGWKSKSSPAIKADMKDSKRKGDWQKSHKSTLRESESKDGTSRSLKKPPSSVPLSRPVIRIPRSEPVAQRCTSPEAPRKGESAKGSKGSRVSSGKKERAVSRKSLEKERHNEQSVSRRRESSVERSRRDDTELSRRRREGSVEAAPPRSKVRDTGKVKSRVDDDGFRDGDEAVSGQANKKGGTVGESDRGLLSDRERNLSKRKEKERRQVRDSHNSVGQDSEQDNEAPRDKSRRFGKKKVREGDNYRESGKYRDQESEKEGERDGDGKRNLKRKRSSNKPAEPERDSSVKREPKRDDEFENEREPKSERKEQGQKSETAQRPKEREDTLKSKTHHQTAVRGPLVFRSEPADKVLARNTQDSRNGHRSDGSPSDIEKHKMRETTPRKPMFRSVPVSAIVESAVGESKSSEIAGAVFRNTKGSASPGSAHASDPLPRPTHLAPTKEELRVLSRTLEQLATEQRELLSQFDSLTKLCDGFLSKEKHDDFEETARKGFGVLFKFCLKKETEMRVRKRLNREWEGTRKEALTKYKQLTRHYGSQRISELEKIGRIRTARFLSHQVHKIYVRMFILQRCWNRDQRMGENEMKSLMSYLHREGSAADKNKLLTQRKIGSIANLLNDYSNILCLFDMLLSDWTDGDDQAGFEISMPFFGRE